MSVQIQQWVVGGSIRDVILGHIPKDIDYVWTGVTPEYLINKGMTQVGANFPVFLDNDNNEHALARIERKTDVGYNGFECDFHPNITIEQDLERRDLTINSMAVKIEDWAQFVETQDVSMVVDPFNGLIHLYECMLFNTSDAFAEDPIRVLRTARFAARYGFTVGIKTLLMMNLVAPELNHVPTERIWAEMFKGFNEKYTDIMFEVLNVAHVFDVKIMCPYKQVDYGSLGKNRDADIVTKFCMAAGGFTKEDYHTMSIPNEFAQMSHAFNQQRFDLQNYSKKTAVERLEILTKLRAFNNNDIVDAVLNVFIRCSPVYGQFIVDVVMHDIERVRMIDAAEISKQFKTGEEIKRAIYDARLSKLM
jgi:tRNA nucleotidyltransferase (CCA-adding enzyme)